MAVVTVTRSPVMLVGLDDLKAHLRVDADFDDLYITSCYWAALWDAEVFTHRALAPQTVQLLLDGFPGYTTMGLGAAVTPALAVAGYTQSAMSAMYASAGAIVLPRPRLQQIDFLKYIDTNADEQTLDPLAYMVDRASEPARIAPAPNTFWPLTLSAFQGAVLNAVTIQYQAGYTLALTLPDGVTPDEAAIRAGVPEIILHALKLMVTQLYEVRAPVLAGPRVAAIEIPMTLERLLYSQKVIYS